MMSTRMAPMARPIAQHPTLGTASNVRARPLTVTNEAADAVGGNRRRCRATHALEHFAIGAPGRARPEERGRDEEPPATDPTREALLDELCVRQDVGSGPARRPFTQRESQRLNAIRWAARSTTSRAYMVLGRGDRYLDTITNRVFHADIDVGRASSQVASIRQKLDTVPIEMGTCADADCHRGGVLAFTTDDLSTIVLCPRLFSTSPGEMRRTLIHEAGHAAGIDSSVTSDEQYCTETPGVDCQDPCAGLSGDATKNVDAWAHFVECAASS
jgi:hypothetical protein